LCEKKTKGQIEMKKKEEEEIIERNSLSDELASLLS